MKTLTLWITGNFRVTIKGKKMKGPKMSVIITLNSNEKEDLRFVLQVALSVIEEMKIKPGDNMKNTIKKILEKISPEEQERVKK